MMRASQLVLATGVFALLAALNMFGKSKETDTTIKEPAFRLTLPGQWSSKPSSDATRWEYCSGDKRENLTVSFFGVKNGISADKRSKMFKRFVEVRKHADSAPPGLTAITTTETIFGDSGGILAARYNGTEPAVHRRFTCLMLGTTSAFTVFYYEAIGFSQSETDARARAIMNSIAVPR